MNTFDFFYTVVRYNYDEFRARQYDYRLLWNALMAMNTVPEYIVLEKENFRDDMSRDELYEKANKVREADEILTVLRKCVETMRYGGKVDGKQKAVQASSPPEGDAAETSTGNEMLDDAIWRLLERDREYDLADLAHKAFPVVQELAINSLRTQQASAEAQV